MRARLLMSPIRHAAWRVGRCAVIAVVALATARLTCAEDHGQKLDRALQRAAAEHPTTHRVIIRTKHGHEATVEDALRQHGDVVLGEHASVHGFSAEIHDADLAQLAASDAITSVSADAVVTAQDGGQHEQQNNNGLAPSTLRTILGLTDTSLTGAGIGVAVIDSGLQPSRDFAGRVTAFFDFTAGDAATPPRDGYGHGTHVAGLIGSNGRLSGGTYGGVAPRARLIILKVLNEHGEGRTSDVLRALEFAVARKADLGIDVINLSLGHPIYEPATTDPLVEGVEAAVRAGVVVVVAGGNFGGVLDTSAPGYAGITSPGNAPSAITVGALCARDTTRRRDQRVAPYSSRGPTWYDAFAKPDVLTPGHQLVSNAAQESYLYTNYPALRVTAPTGVPFLQLSGTSMAAAVTSGVVALMLEANRAVLDQAKNDANGANDDAHATLTPNTVKAILQYTALPVFDASGAEVDGLTEGTGGLNVLGAIALAKSLDTTTPVGSPWLMSAVIPATTIAGETWPWAQRVIWGGAPASGSLFDINALALRLDIVWGSAVLASPNIVWGSNVVWGSNLVWGSAIAWRTNIVWGNALLPNIVWGSDIPPDDPGFTVVWGSLALAVRNIVWGSDVPPDDPGFTVVWGSLALSPLTAMNTVQ